MRNVEDHHVDRLGVEAWQHVKLTGTNRSIGLIAPTNSSRAAARTGRIALTCSMQTVRQTKKDNNQGLKAVRRARSNGPPAADSRPRVHRWSGSHGGGPSTRSHPELGRESPQRRWYCILRCGRVGRRQAFHGRQKTNRNLFTNLANGYRGQPVPHPKLQTSLSRGGAVR